MGGWLEDEANKVNAPASGAAAGNIISGPVGAAVGASGLTKGKGTLGDIMSGNMHGVSQDLGLSNDKGDKANADFQANVEKQHEDNQGVLAHMKQLGQNYQGSMGSAGDTYKQARDPAISKYMNDVDTARAESTTQAKDAHAAYSNDILPKMHDLMQQSSDNAKGAMSIADYTKQSRAPIAGQMSLQEAEDPNNRVAQGMRDMYGTQAQGIQKQGLSDYGVLAGLGSEATANTLGGMGPMTGGQMQALQGSNMGAASGAFANAQNQANNLRLQGIQAGTDQSNRMFDAGQRAQQQQFDQVSDVYGAGQQAQRFAGENVGNYEGMVGRDTAQQNNFTQQKLGYGQEQFGTKMGQAQGNYDIAQNNAGIGYNTGVQADMAQMGESNAYHGAQQGIDTAQAQAAAQAQGAKAGLFGKVVGMGVGGFFGGAPGAQAGGDVGQAGGKAMADNTPVYGQPQRAGGGYSPGMYGGYGGSMYS